MKFNFKRSKTLDSITKVASIPTSKSLPILSGIKIAAEKEGITLTGSDTDITVITFVPVQKDELEVSQPGSIVVQGKLFTEIIKKAPVDEILIDVAKDLTAKVKSGKSKFNLNGLDPEEFPREPFLDESKFIVIKSSVLKSVINKTAFAVSTSETRPILTGVKFKKDKDFLTVIATDSHRLAMVKESLITDEEMPEVVISAKQLIQVLKMLPDTDTEVKISFMENRMVFKFENTTVITRLLEGNYPDVSRLIPMDYKSRCEIDRRAFYQALERVSLLADDAKKNVAQLSLGELNVISQNSLIGRVKEELEAGLEGEELTISFNVSYLKDALKAIDDPKIVVDFNGQMKPFIIKGIESCVENLQLILPVRTY